LLATAHIIYMAMMIMSTAFFLC